MKDKAKLITSIIMKVIIICSVITGFTNSYLYGHVHGIATLYYFTIQSNIWIAIFDIVALGFLLKHYFDSRYQISNILYKFQQVFTVCISITGIIYCFVLVPGFYADKANAPDGFSPFSYGSVLLHILVPLLSCIDYFMCVRKVRFRYVDSLYTLIPTVYYLGFSLMGYFLNFDFGDGRNWPYFFLNYDSPAGIFGFSDTMPYFMGSFYWILLITIFTIGLSLLYIFIIRRIDLYNLRKEVSKSPYLI